MLNNEKLEDLAMMIIANAGASRGAAFEAMALAKKNDFEAAQEKLKQAEEYGESAHDAHSQLLKLDAKGEVDKVDLLLSHSQDHLMNAQLARELIAEIIELYQKNS
jgi:Phosphotransferase system cellobiose-specific component IIA